MTRENIVLKALRIMVDFGYGVFFSILLNSTLSKGLHVVIELVKVGRVYKVGGDDENVS